ncbi:MAG TPA: AAA family ATPase [Gemmatimonadaceae bacterium]|nr:AAA family ATPase [Gemmatimonadaceae bacterium]
MAHRAQAAGPVIHLRSVSLGRVPDERGFPFTVPAVRAMETLELRAPVTFFVGENGSGKSTLLEGIALAAALPAVGSEDARDDRTLQAQRRLARHFRLSWGRRTHRGFFLRAEDFFGFTRRLARTREEMRARLVEVDEEFRGASAYVRGLAAGPARASLAEMERRYGEDLDASSHGESFLKLFAARFVPDGLYLLDEPEAPLSPSSQLTLLAMMGEMLGRGAQFIIATHSPILLAFPGADIWTFDRTPITRVAYDDLEHVSLTRSFLQDPGGYLRRMGVEGGE